MSRPAAWWGLALPLLGSMGLAVRGMAASPDLSKGWSAT
jgi:hypothetical protein